MSWETVNPVAVVDEECSPRHVVTRYATVAEAEWYIDYLRDYGGDVIRKKVERDGYSIEERR